MKKQLLRSVTVDANTLQAEGTWAQCYKAGNQVFMQGQTGSGSRTSRPAGWAESATQQSRRASRSTTSGE